MLPVSGVSLQDVYQTGVKLVRDERPDLEEGMTKSFGFAMGIEFRENSLVVGPRTESIARKGKVSGLFCINIIK